MFTRKYHGYNKTENNNHKKKIFHKFHLHRYNTTILETNLNIKCYIDIMLRNILVYGESVERM